MASFPPRPLLPTLALCLLASLGASAPAGAAQDPAPAIHPDPASLPAADADARAAWRAASAALRRGPDDIRLNEVAHVTLPAGYGYIPPAEGRRLMEAMGNRTDTNFLGLIAPVDRAPDSPAQWLAELDYVSDGHIADDDARDWHAGDLLQGLKEGTAEGNRFRAAKGVPALEITGWIEPPTYDARQHRLVWSVAARDQGTSAPSSINYNTYVLGREGYVSLNMITDPQHVAADKIEAKKLLGDISFVLGRTYADYHAGTDRLAEYGLAALVGGVVLKKAGVLALLGVAIAKFFKVLVVAGLGLLAGLKKWLDARKGASLQANGQGPNPGRPEALDPGPQAGVNLRKD